MTLDLTSVILTKNEQDNLPRCLESLSWCPNLLIIDDYSEDETTSIAKKHGAKIIKNRLNQDFAAQRNFALSKVTTTWTLFIDADEVVTPELKSEILQSIKSAEHQAYQLKRQDYFIGKFLKFGESAKWQDVRLAKTSAGHWHGKVHETWTGFPSIGALQNPIHHYPHPSLHDFIHDINYYSTLRAQELHQLISPVSFFSIILYPIAKFFKNYLFLQGFRDGSHGVVHAGLMAFHSFLVRGKLYLLNNKS